MTALVITILLIPLAGAFINGILCISSGWRALLNSMSSGIAVFASAASFLFTLILWRRLSAQAWLAPPIAFHTGPLAQWISVGSFHIDLGFTIDPLSLLLMLIITGIGTLIHLYSVGAMAKDPGTSRYFSYLNLFLFFMLLLVTSDNLLVLFVGWEGVGLCSYLLIGFWYDDAAKATAGKKAFIVNRIGDFGFLVALFFIVKILGAIGTSDSPLHIETLRAHMDLLLPMATPIALLLFLGAIGKSAQIPLYVWLPDAMAGPTPVSALIHAATMVTAGVYLIARLFFLFSASALALNAIMTIGVATAFLAASIALVQTDIKKVLAYSTVSQLGLMMLGLGVGAPSTAIFHLLTHAFFKACLFLGAGSVIHALAGEQDIRQMGGLWKKMPVTAITFFISTLAIAGVPPFAGFFSKDAILEAVWAHGYPWCYGIGLVTAAMTAFYMMRLASLVFLGQGRLSPSAKAHIHESPGVMTWPLVVLALGASCAGFLNVPELFGGTLRFHQWLAPALGSAPLTVPTTPHGLLLAVISTALVCVAIALAYFLYASENPLPARLSTQARLAHNALKNGYGIDRLYERMIVRPLHWVSANGLYKIGELKIIDGFGVESWSRLAQAGGKGFSRLQTGRIATAVFYMVVGVAILAGLLL